MRIAIVGSGADKFTPETEREAKAIIRFLLKYPGAVLVSGHSPLGGIDIWAEEIAKELGRRAHIFEPLVQQWNPSDSIGYKARNLAIAQDCDEIHVIIPATYPETYTDRRFKLCYHCKTSDHIKSGGCWTAKQAEKLGKKAVWHVV